MEPVSGKGKRGFLAKTWPLFLLLSFLAVAVWYGENLKGRAEVGRAAPAFSLPSVAGGEVALEDFRGQPVIVNFWATWCPYCRYETPAHQTFLQRFGDHVAYVAVNLREPADKVMRHREEFAAAGIPLDDREDLLDRNGKVFSLYRSTGTPETWIIDGEGRAVHHFIGPSRFEDLVGGMAEAGVQLWQPPPTGWVTALSMAGHDGADGFSVWLGAEKGVYHLRLATDAGSVASLEGVPLPLTGIRSLSASPDGNTVWAVGRWALEGAADLGTDLAFNGSDSFSLVVWDGTGWTRRLEGETPLAVAVGDEDRVYVWSRERGLLVSDDGGRTWDERRVPFKPETAGVAMAVAPGNPDHVLSAGPGGVWQSRDGGVTWEATDIKGQVSALVFDARRRNRVYVVDGEGVLVSDDGGRTGQRWTGSPQRSLVGVAALPSTGDPVAVAPNGDVYTPPRPGERALWQLWTLTDLHGPRG